MKYTAMVKSALVAALGLVVGTASADVAKFTEDFESYDIGTNISYIAAQPGAQWYAGGEDDTSAIEAGNGGKLLNLNTEGGTVSNKIDTADLAALNTAIGGDGIALDALVQFVASDDDKTIPEGGDLKFALFAYGDEDAAEPYTNLVVTHSIMLQGGAIVKTNTVTDIAIDCDELTAVKVTMKKFSGEYGAGVKAPVAFQVKIGDTVVTSANAYSEAALAEDYNGTAAAGGNWFLIASMANDTLAARENIQALALQGTGKIDDIALSVVENAPDFFQVGSTKYKEAQAAAAFLAATNAPGASISFLQPYTIAADLDLTHGFDVAGTLTVGSGVTVKFAADPDATDLNDYFENFLQVSVVGEDGTAKAVAGDDQYVWDTANSNWKNAAVAITLPAVPGLTASCATAKAVPGSEVTVTFAAAQGYISAGGSAVYIVQNDGSLVLKEGETVPTATLATVIRIAKLDSAETLYTTIAAAIADAAEGDTVKLLDDATETITVAAGKDIVLDLNGNTLANSISYYTIDNLGALEVIDSSAGKGGKIDHVTADTSSTIRNLGSLEISDVTVDGNYIGIKNDEGAGCNGGKGYGELVLNGVTFCGDDQAVQNWGKAVINGGVFKGPVFTWADNANQGNVGGETVIIDGIFSNTVWSVNTWDGSAWPTIEAKVVISGGVFEAQVAPAKTTNYTGSDPANCGNIVIPALVDSALNGAKFKVQPVVGADLAIDPAEGYEFALVDGYYMVQVPAPTVIKVARINGGDLMGLHDALAQAVANDVVTLEDDVDLSGEAWVPVNFAGGAKFDGQGHTIANLTVNNTEGTQGQGLFGETGGDVTVKNLVISNATISAANSERVAVVAGNLYTGLASNITVCGTITVTGKKYVAGIVGWGYGDTVDCHVDGGSAAASTISAVTTTEGQVGGIVGFMGEGATCVQDCTVKNITVAGYERAGGVIGRVHTNCRVINCSAENVVVKAATPNEIGALAGTKVNGTAAWVLNSTATNVTLKDLEDNDVTYTLLANNFASNGTITGVDAAGLNLYAASKKYNLTAGTYTLSAAGLLATLQEQIAEGYEAVPGVGENVWIVQPLPPPTILRISQDGTTTNGYTDLGVALAALVNGDTVQFVGTVTNHPALNVEGKTFTFDLNGQEVAFYDQEGVDSVNGAGYGINFKTGTSVTIVDNSVAGNGRFVKLGCATFFTVDSTSTITMNSGSIQVDTKALGNDNGSHGCCIKNQGTVTVNGGFFDSLISDHKDGVISTRSGSTTTINGGTFHGKFDPDYINSATIAIPGYVSNALNPAKFYEAYDDKITGTPTNGGIFKMFQGADDYWMVKEAWTVTFQTNGVTYTTSIVEKGTVVAAPTAPAAPAGYTFNGWKLNDAAFDFATAPTADTTLVADFQAEAPSKTYPNYITDDLKDAFDAWADAKAEGDRDTANAKKDQFLMNIAPSATAELTITSITVDGSDATITIDGGAANLGAINGVLFVRSADTLAGLATGTVTSTGFTVSEGDATVTISVGKFFKAYVDFAAPSAD